MLVLLILDIVCVASILGLVIKMVNDDRKFDKMIQNIESYVDVEDI